MTSDGLEIEREECWFLDCRRSPDGLLHGDDGFSVAACEKHGEAGESLGWENFERLGGNDGAE